MTEDERRVAEESQLMVHAAQFFEQYLKMFDNAADGNRDPDSLMQQAKFLDAIGCDVKHLSTGLMMFFATLYRVVDASGRPINEIFELLVESCQEEADKLNNELL